MAQLNAAVDDTHSIDTTLSADIANLIKSQTFEVLNFERLCSRQSGEYFVLLLAPPYSKNQFSIIILLLFQMWTIFRIELIVFVL